MPAICRQDFRHRLHARRAGMIKPIHINFFARKSLGALLQRSGFAIQRTYSLPIPSSSVRNVYGWAGFVMMLPYLAFARGIGKADGTTLLTMAKPI